MLPPVQLMTSCVIHSDPLAISSCFNAAITRFLLLASFHQILNWLPSSSMSALSTLLGMCPSTLDITPPYHLRQPSVSFWETRNISEQLSETRIPLNKLFTTHEKHRDDNIVASFADTRPLVFCWTLNCTFSFTRDFWLMITRSYHHCRHANSVRYLRFRNSSTFPHAAVHTIAKQSGKCNGLRRSKP